MQADPLPERFRVQARLDEMHVVRARLVHWLEAQAVADTTREELTLVLDEAATNIVRHAYPSHAFPDGPGVIDLEFHRKGQTIQLRLWDDGIERREEDCVGLPLGEPGESGMGMNLIRLLTSDLSFRRTQEGRNLLELHRQLFEDGSRLA